MENDATNSPGGMVLDMESLRTSSPAAGPVLIRRKIRAGLAPRATAPLCTAACSSRLSEEETKRLMQIRAERRRNLLPSLTDMDWVLELIERLTR